MTPELHRLAPRRTAGVAFGVIIAVGALYVLALANLTVWPTPGSGPRNLVPFDTIWNYLTTDYPARIRFRNIAGNVALLAPLGLLLALTTSWRLPRTAVAIVTTSACIELLQLSVATGRSVDIDDVILNTIGGAIGFIAGLGVIRLLERIAPKALKPIPAPTAEPVRQAA